VAVIAPWNFRWRSDGNGVRRLVAGNTIVVKPAEQSPLIGAELHAIFLVPACDAVGASSKAAARW